MNEYDACEAAYKNGYEKGKREVAREIFEEIEKCMAHDYISTIGVYNGALELRIAELKKKYTGGKAMKCAYNIDEICVNPDCPYRADYCPCYEEDSICKYRKEEEKT